MKRSFRTYVENTDIFGFEGKKPLESPDDALMSRPINQFNIALMMEYLTKKSLLGFIKPTSKFINEMQWGEEPGAIRLEVDTGLTFLIKKLNHDLTGTPRWITKRMYQLNRYGYGGMEDSVAQEVFEHIERYYKMPMEGPLREYEDLENLVIHLSNKLKRTAKNIFLYDGIKKLNDNNYIISFGIRGHGLESSGHSRVESNQVQITFDEEAGTLRITNFNIESPVGGPHSWEIQPVDLNMYFFPTQDRDEISECLAVHMKYY